MAHRYRGGNSAAGHRGGAEAGPKTPLLAGGLALVPGNAWPAIWLAPLGRQSMTDRCTCIPLIGVFLVAVWGLGDLAAGRSYFRKALVAVAAGLLLIYTLRAGWEVAGWANTESLLRGAKEAAADNTAERSGRTAARLAKALAGEGLTSEAIECYREALGVQPDDALRQNHRGLLLRNTASSPRLQRVGRFRLHAVMLDSQTAHCGRNFARRRCSDSAYWK